MKKEEQERRMLQLPNGSGGHGDGPRKKIKTGEDGSYRTDLVSCCAMPHMIPRDLILCCVHPVIVLYSLCVCVFVCISVNLDLIIQLSPS